MDEFVPLANIDAIADGEGASFTVGDRVIAVFRYGGEFFAIDDMCPHMGASLSAGTVCDGTVTCPWHAWRFCIREGTWCDNPRLKIDRFDVRVEDDQILVRVPADRKAD